MKAQHAPQVNWLLIGGMQRCLRKSNWRQTNSSNNTHCIRRHYWVDLTDDGIVILEEITCRSSALLFGSTAVKSLIPNFFKLNWPGMTRPSKEFHSSTVCKMRIIIGTFYLHSSHCSPLLHLQTGCPPTWRNCCRAKRLGCVWKPLSSCSSSVDSTSTALLCCTFSCIDSIHFKRGRKKNVILNTRREKLKRRNKLLPWTFWTWPCWHPHRL